MKKRVSNMWYMFVFVSTLVALSALPVAADSPAAIVRTNTPIEVDGQQEDWAEITAEHRVLNLQQEPVASFKLAYDEERLYATFYVDDESPIQNSSSVLEEVLKGGDAVGLCLGSVGDEGASQRILATRVDDQNLVVAYRPQWSEKRSHTFSSPTGEMVMEYVGPVDGAEVAFAKTADGYRAELSLPWSELNLSAHFSATIPFDVQVIFSDPAGVVNESTAWWNTSGGPGFTTEDLPTEAALYPEHWGEARLYDKDPGPRQTRRERVERVGVPVAFELPRDARVSMLIADKEGWIVRELLRAEEMEAGEHTVYWDGRDRYDEALPPGQYTWRMAYFDGMGTEFHGSVGNSARPPFRTADGKGSMGGQHGGPSVIAADETGVYIAGGAEEGHPAMRKIDRDGYTLWKRSMGGFGRGMALATDGRYAYLIRSPGRGGRNLTLYRLDPETGREVPLTDEKERVTIAAERNNIGGMAVAGDRAYVSFTDEDRIVVVDLATASLLNDIDMEQPLGLARGPESRLLVCTGDAIKAVEPGSEEPQTILEGLEAAHALAVDGEGRLYVSELGDIQQIKVFDGQERVATIGVKGGRPDTEMEYDPRAMREMRALAIDGEGDVWGVERSGLRRVARYALNGECELELFGPVAYNVFGPDLDDMSRVYFQPSRGSKGTLYALAHLDYEAYRADPVRGATGAWDIEAVFDLDQEEGASGTDLMSGPMKAGYGHVVSFTADNGHRYLWRIAKSNRATTPAGAAIWRWKNGERWVPAAFISNKNTLQSWSDTNGDGMVQPQERYDPPPTGKFAWLDRDLTLYGWAGTIEPTRVDDRGVPYYDGSELSPYLDENEEYPSVMQDTWVFNSMPDSDNAVYYAANYGPHRHRTTWDRASENAIVKVQDGSVQWIIGKNDPYMRTEGALNTVTGIAGVVDDILIAHIVEPAHYIAYTTDGFTLGNVIVDEEGKRPGVGPNAIYIESFTGLFLQDPENDTPLLFAVSSGDDRILEVTGPGDITRVEGNIELPSSFPREKAPHGQAVIPYETWYGSRSRGFGINGYDWHWQPEAKGFPVYEQGAVIGDVRLRRDAGSLYMLASVLGESMVEPDVETDDPRKLWGAVPGVELMFGPARPVEGREPVSGDTRIFLAMHDDDPVALYRRHDDEEWRTMPEAQVAMVDRWNDYGWRLEARIPLSLLPEITSKRTQTFRRSPGGDTKIVTQKEERLDMTGPVRLNAAFHLNGGEAMRRVPWVDDGGSLEEPGEMHPGRWGFGNVLVDLSWPNIPDVQQYTVFRAPRGGRGDVTVVADAVMGTQYIDTPGPGDFVYWIAPETEDGTGQPVGPVFSRESAADFPPFEPEPPHPFESIDELVVRENSHVGLITVALEAEELLVKNSPGLTVETNRQTSDTWRIAVLVPEKSRMGDVYNVRLAANTARGETIKSDFDVVVGVDMMAQLPLGSMASPEDGRSEWGRDPETDATGNPRNSVTVTDKDGVPSPCIEMDAWNTNNTITYPLDVATIEDSWRASGYFRVLSHHGTTTVGVRVRDDDGRTVADFHFGRRKFDGEWARYLSMLGEYVITDNEVYDALAGQWSPFSMTAEDGKVRMTYGRGPQRQEVEKDASPESNWAKPREFQVYLGGRTSGRKIRVDNLQFVGK